MPLRACAASPGTQPPTPCKTATPQRRRTSPRDQGPRWPAHAPRPRGRPARRRAAPSPRAGSWPGSGRAGSKLVRTMTRTRRRRGARRPCAPPRVRRGGAGCRAPRYAP
uniref:Uncharacterized protein n=1 Tax=Zea mays TaxID=4577 RepID=C4J7R9_MAIZE|nr:unknown [Zea mays]